MRLALTVDCSLDRDLIFAQQLGVREIVASDCQWDRDSLAGTRNRVEKAGLELVAVENLAQSMYTKAIVGLDGRDEEIETVCQAIRNAGVVGIPTIGYRWTLPSANRTRRAPLGRGAALVGSYDHSLAQRAQPPVAKAPTPEEMWRNLGHFLERVIPVAEEAGVRLACHPDDPPAPSLDGVPRILNNVEGLDRLLEMGDSSCHGLDFCLGTVAAMPGVDVIQAICHFGRKGKIFMLHVRNVRGALPDFRDAFLDAGDLLIPKALLACRSVGFAGPIRSAPPPGMIGDTDWGHKGRAFDLGYLRALLQVLEGIPENVWG